MPRTYAEFTCDWCRKTFAAYPSRRPRPHRFCGAACARAWQDAGKKPPALPPPLRPLGRRPLLPEERKSAKVDLRLTPQERTALAELAAAAGETESETLRRLIREATG